MNRRTLLPLIVAAPSWLLGGCDTSSLTVLSTAGDAAVTSDAAAADALQPNAASSLSFDNAAWHYDESNDVYWQIGVHYCTKPAAEAYETLGIYVPGAYLQATDNGDGTYTAQRSTAGVVNGYTAATAPVVFPVNTPGYSAQAAPTAYNWSEVSSYLQAGFVYVAAGMRGRANGYDSEGNLAYSGGAPWGITDLKAAVRYYRYNAAALPGSAERLITFGMSGGGAQSSLMGASGDSPLYTPYLESIGAAMVDPQGRPLSDAVSGAMAWCPITSLDFADAAYEWNMGQFASTDTRVSTSWRSALSEDLAVAFPTYLNGLELKTGDGTPLRLDPSPASIYAAGTYYDHLVAVIEESLNNFLKDNTFPYTQTTGGGPAGGTPPSGDLPDAQDGGTAVSMSTAQTATTYATVEEYIASLNAEETWVRYDAVTNTAHISGLAAFAKYVKTASKSVPAFDDVERAQAENDLFGNADHDALHFDATVAELLRANQTRYAGYTDWDASLLDAYSTDLTQLDALGTGLTQRQNMYNPMYYVTAAKRSTLAKHWRINTGITQGDTANTVELNLALALDQRPEVEDVAFTTVWGQGHTQAERTGDSTTNFISWVTQISPP